MGICKSTNKSDNNENLGNSPKYQTTANSESIPADKNNSAIYENFNNNINNNMNNCMNYNMNNCMNYNMDNNFSSQYNPNLFSYNYLNGTSQEINGKIFSPNSIYIGTNNRKNITFQEDNGTKTLLPVPSDITIYQLIKMYLNRRGLQNYDLRRDLVFYYNTERIDPFSKELIGKKFRDKTDNINITVSTTMNLIGGLKLY